MDGDDLSDDVFMDKQIINQDELRLSHGQIPTVSVAGQEDVRIFAPLDYEDDSWKRVHENYFYPADAAVSEGWRSYKIEDEEPFGPIGVVKSRSTNHFQASSQKKKEPNEFDDSVTHKVFFSDDKMPGWY